MNNLINVIGWIAAVLGACMYAPQMIKVLKNKSAKGLSKTTFTIATFGNGMWLVYMGSIGNFANTASGWAVNAIIGFMMLPILYYIYRDKFIFRLVAYAWFIFTMTISLYWEIRGDKLESWEQILLVIVAGGTTSFGFVPQIIKIFKTKKVGNLSLHLVAMYALVNALWATWWILSIAYTLDKEAIVGAYISFSLDIIGFVVQFYLGYLFIKYKNNKV